MIEAHEEEPPSVNWPQQYQEEECQSQFVANYNGQYMEEECTYYHEQTTTTLENEETIREMFSEPSLEDPLEECFAQFEFDLDLDTICEQDEAILDSTPKNNKVEKEEVQIEVLEEPHWEKEESTETSSTSAHILDIPRAQERSRLGLCDEQIEDIKIEKLSESSSYFIPVHDEKLFEKTQSSPPRYI